MDSLEMYNLSGAHTSYSVTLDRVFSKPQLKLHAMTPDIPLNNIHIDRTDVNRPSLQIVGFYDIFNNDRIQVLGGSEVQYMHAYCEDNGVGEIERILQVGIPCLVFTNAYKPEQEFIDLGIKYNTPVFSCELTTSLFVAGLVHILEQELAPRVDMHGVLMDIYGEGVLITGESGVGKSETALALIKRGHRFVADDLVELRQIGNEIIGSAPELTRNFIELRGVGILDVKTMFGVENVKDRKAVSMVIHLEDWDKKKNYDRLGLDEEFVNILGVDMPRHDIPVSPSRFLPIIIEAVAVNNRQKKMGYNAAQELYNKALGNFEI